MPFDATVGGANSNSYVTLAAAEAYFLGRLNVTEWTDSEEWERQSALVMATQRLESEAYLGVPTTTTQRLLWPRMWVYDRNGVAFSSSAIPYLIQEATCELALTILKDPDMLGGDSGLAEYANLRIGSLDVTPRARMVGVLPMPVLRSLVPVRIAGFMGRVVRA